MTKVTLRVNALLRMTRMYIYIYIFTTKLEHFYAIFSFAFQKGYLNDPATGPTT
jgi:hypothetical protein